MTVIKKLAYLGFLTLFTFLFTTYLYQQTSQKFNVWRYVRNYTSRGFNVTEYMVKVNRSVKHQQLTTFRTNTNQVTASQGDKHKTSTAKTIPTPKKQQIQLPSCSTNDIETIDNKMSYYYGLKHIWSNGKECVNCSDFFVKRDDDWKMFFRSLTSGIKDYYKSNPNKTSDRFTSDKSECSVPKKIFKVGEQFVAYIQAKDRLGKNKTFGGDYFRARLISGSPTQKYPENGFACKVQDHSNGTYIISTPLYFAGTFTLDVKLLTSIEATELMVIQSESKNYKGVYYIVTLISDEDIICYWDINEMMESHKKMDKCNYGNPRNKEAWICTKPESGICHPMKYVNVAGTRFELGEFDSNFVKRFSIEVAINKPAHIITVQNPNPEKFDSQNLSSTKCLTLKSQERPNGYIRNKKWQSLLCGYNKTMAQMYSLLNNKVVYLIGDSTTLQFFTWFQQRPDTKTKIAPLGPRVWQTPAIAFNEKINFTLYYRTHGPPIRIPGPPCVRFYITDVLDDIEFAGENVTIMFQIGLHIYTSHPSLFLHRLNGIKEAALRLRARQPGTKFIFKGFNVLEGVIDWFGYRWNCLAREVFKDIEFITFLDFWDLTTIWYLEKSDFHPVPQILNEEVSLLLHYLTYK